MTFQAQKTICFDTVGSDNFGTDYCMGRVQKTDKGVKKTLWQKLKGLNADNNNERAKRKLFYLLTNALQGGAKVGQHVLVGTNTVLKSIRERQASVVCVSRDSPKSLFNCVIEACALTATPVVALPSTSAVEMASTFLLKKATIFALPLGSIEKSAAKKVDCPQTDVAEVCDVNNGNTISDADRIDGMIDGVREVAMSMYTPNFLFRVKSIS